MRKTQPPLDADALRDLTERLAAVSDPALLRRLLDELLTPAECRDLALRWRLLDLLRQGVPQRRIARILGVSLCKITRGSGVLKQPGSVCSALLSGAHTNLSRKPPA